MAELLLAFKRHADVYYVVDGQPTAEVDCFNSAMRPVRELFAMLPARDFGPLHLKAVQAKYVESGWSRGFGNKSMNRIRHIWKWAVGNGLVPVPTWQALTAVPPLKAGHTAAPDHKRREAVSDDTIEAVRPYLAQHHRDLFDLLRATGARPSELLGLTMADIDTSGEIWIADVEKHKNANHGLSRKLFFGPRSQLILRRCPTTGPLLADLFGMRFVVSQETEDGSRLAESLVKSLTGGDKIRARRMREDFWQFDPTHKFALCTNHKPLEPGQGRGRTGRTQTKQDTPRQAQGGSRSDPGMGRSGLSRMATRRTANSRFRSGIDSGISQ